MKRLPWPLLAPALLFVGALFLLPVAALLLRAFQVDGGFGLANFAAFFEEPLHRQVYWRTLRLAALATLVSALVCYPAALAMVKVPPPWRGLLTALVILPLMVSPIARTYSWIVLLGRNGFVNATLQALGLADAPLKLLFTEGAVFVGKSNVGDMAFSSEAANFVYGATNHPKDSSRTAGGSTGGGAAAVAKGFAAFDWGGDFGGSIRIPAAFCGIVGLRLASRDYPLAGEHFPPMPGSLLNMLGWGPLTRTVAEAAELVRVAEPLRRPSAIAREFEANDVAILPPDEGTVGEWPSFTRDLTALLDRGGFQFTFGVPGVSATSAARAFDRYLCARFDGFIETGFLPTTEALARVAKGLLRRGPVDERIHPSTGLLLSLTAFGHGLFFWDKAGSLERASKLTSALDRVWDSGRLILSPTTTFAAPRHGRTPLCRGLQAFAKLGNLVDATAISIPFGTFDSGLPRGLQILGPSGSEGAVLALASRLEALLAA